MGWEQLPNVLAGVARVARRFRWGPGVLAMVTSSNVVGLVVVGLVFFGLSAYPLFALCGAMLIIGYLIYSSERAYRYAEKNPLPALLGGAELVQVLQQQQSQKDRSEMRDDEAQPIAGASAHLIDGSQ